MPVKDSFAQAAVELHPCVEIGVGTLLNRAPKLGDGLPKPLLADVAEVKLVSYMESKASYILEGQNHLI